MCVSLTVGLIDFDVGKVVDASVTVPGKLLDEPTARLMKDGVGV